MSIAHNTPYPVFPDDYIVDFHGSSGSYNTKDKADARKHARKLTARGEKFVYILHRKTGRTIAF